MSGKGMMWNSARRYKMITGIVIVKNRVARVIVVGLMP
jgi:hypothetical protein